MTNTDSITCSHDFIPGYFKSLRGQRWFKKCNICSEYVDATAERRSEAGKKAAATRKAREEACKKCYGQGYDRRMVDTRSETGRRVTTYVRIKCEACEGTGKRSDAYVNPYSVGDILNGSWGYDQTNQEFYQVVAVSGKSVTIREVAQYRTHIEWATERCYPSKDNFIGEPMRRLVSRDGYVKAHGSCVLRAWSGTGKVATSYA